MRNFALKRSVVPALAVVVLALSACADDGPTTVTPPTPDAAFLGYANVATQQTTCGTCHVDKQRDWVRTRHASAWADLQNSGHAAPSCEKCHTTNGFSNLASDSAGYFAVAADARPLYRDVQCESCHGPGSSHQAAPGDVQPLSSIFADTAATYGCGTCHTGAHTPFVEQWRVGGHGTAITYAAGRPASDGCPSCHEGKAATIRFDPNARFIEQGSSTLFAQTCAVCHDPHGSPNTAQLRLPINTPSLETNLCMQCHNRRSVPDPTSSRGPHTPQGPMLLGEAGWVPQDFAYDAARAMSSHGGTGNPRLCAGCHMERFAANDAATGAFLIQNTGHLFRAIPCVDANGAPTVDNNCADTGRRYNACVSSGCHSSGNVARAARQVLQGRMQLYVDALWKDMNNNGNLDAFPTDSGLLARVKATTPGDFSTSGTGATIVTVGEGVFFNTDMIKRADGSWGVHNPFYAEALMISSTQALRARYTYLPAPPADERVRIEARMRALGMTR